MADNRETKLTDEKPDSKKASDAFKERRRAPYSGDDKDPLGQSPENQKRREHAERLR